MISGKCYIRMMSHRWTESPLTILDTDLVNLLFPLMAHVLRHISLRISLEVTETHRSSRVLSTRNSVHDMRPMIVGYRSEML